MRRLFTALSVLSLLLCVAVVVLWVRSRWWYAIVYTTTTADDGSHRRFGIGTADGRLQLFKASGAGGQHGFEFIHILWSRMGDSVMFDDAQRRWQFAGFRWYAYSTEARFGDSLRGITCDNFEAPLWCIFLLTAVTPAVWIGRNARLVAKKRISGRCRRCGYDLRVTPDRCPECGTVPRQVPAAPVKTGSSN